MTGFDGRQDVPGTPPDSSGPAERAPMPFRQDAFGTIMEILAFKARLIAPARTLAEKGLPSQCCAIFLSAAGCWLLCLCDTVTKAGGDGPMEA